MAQVIRHNGDGTHTTVPVANLNWLRRHAGQVHTIVITRDPSGHGAKLRALMVSSDFLTDFASLDLAKLFVNRSVFDGVALYIANDGPTKSKPIDFYGQGYELVGTDVRTTDDGGKYGGMVLRAACKPSTMPIA